MNKYEVIIDGQKYEVESQSPLTDAQAYEYASQQASAPNVVQTQKTLPKVDYNPKAEVLRSFVGQGLGLGFGDEIEAAIRSRSLSGPEYEKIRDQLRAQQQSFKSDFPAIQPAAEIGGAVAPAFASGGTGAAPSMMRNIGMGSLLGTAQGVGQSENMEAATGQGLMGAAVGGGVSGLMGLAGRAINPILQPGARDLMREGVALTPGAATGGTLQSIEQAAESVPFVGNLIKGARAQSFETFDKAALNRALKPLGSQTVPKDLDTRGGLGFVRDQIERQYNKVYPNVKLASNKTLERQLDALESRYASGKLPSEQLQQFTGRLNSLRAMLANGPISGNRVKAIKQDLRDDAIRYRQATGSEGLLGDAFSDLDKSISMSLQNQNRGIAKELKKADEAYANFVRLQLATPVGQSVGGTFSPAQLAQSSARADTSKRKAASREGRALMQDLALKGVDVIGTKVPDSGTAGRGAVIAGLAGGAAQVDPFFGGATLLGSTLYTNPGMNALQKFLAAQRPELLQSLGRGATASAPFAGIPAAGLLGE